MASVPVCDLLLPASRRSAHSRAFITREDLFLTQQPTCRSRRRLRCAPTHAEAHADGASTWAAALEAYDAQDFDGALGYVGAALLRTARRSLTGASCRLFDEIADTSRIHFNIGLILATCGRHEEAVAAFRRATELDTFFAVAFFQCGVSNFLLQRYEEARADFDDAYQVRSLAPSTDVAVRRCVRATALLC